MEPNQNPTPNQNPEQAPAEPSLILGAPERPGDKPEIAPAPAAEPVQMPVQPTLAAAPAAMPAANPAPALPAQGKRIDGTDLSAGEKFFAGVSYLGVLAIGTLIIALMSGDNKFVKHHALQGMVLSVAFIVLEAVGIVLGGLIPGLEVLIQILTIASWIIGFALAFSGQWFRIPVVADLADRVGGYLDDLVAEGRNRKHDELVETIDTELDRRVS